MKPIHKSLVWLRNDLRLHDTESITIAAEKSQFVTVLYCFDSGFYRKNLLGISKTGYHRTKFLFETLENLKEQYENWQSEVYKYYTEAVSLGLTNSDVNIETASVSRIRAALNSILNSAENGELYKKGSANRFNEKTKELVNTRDSLIRNLSIAKNELNKIEQLEKSKEDYLDDVIREKENRLRPVEWILEQNGTNLCPFCDSESSKAMDELLSLNEARDVNRKILDQAKSLGYDFEEEKKQ